MLVVHPSSTCDVCLDSYTWSTPSNSPHAIACGHVFCQSCLRSLNPSICPLCRKAFQPDRVKKLHVDRFSASEDESAVIRANELLQHIALVSGENATVDEVTAVISEVHNWFTSQPESSETYKPLRMAVAALHRNQTLTEKFEAELHALKTKRDRRESRLNKLELSARTSRYVESDLLERLKEAEKREERTKKELAMTELEFNRVRVDHARLRTELARYQSPSNPLPRPPQPVLPEELIVSAHMNSSVSRQSTLQHPTPVVPIDGGGSGGYPSRFVSLSSKLSGHMPSVPEDIESIYDHRHRQSLREPIIIPGARADDRIVPPKPTRPLYEKHHTSMLTEDGWFEPVHIPSPNRTPTARIGGFECRAYAPAVPVSSEEYKAEVRSRAASAAGDDAVRSSHPQRGLGSAEVRNHNHGHIIAQAPNAEAGPSNLRVQASIQGSQPAVVHYSGYVNAQQSLSAFVPNISYANPQPRASPVFMRNSGYVPQPSLPAIVPNPVYVSAPPFVSAHAAGDVQQSFVVPQGASTHHEEAQEAEAVGGLMLYTAQENGDFRIGQPTIERAARALGIASGEIETDETTWGHVRSALGAPRNNSTSSVALATANNSNPVWNANSASSSLSNIALLAPSNSQPQDQPAAVAPQNAQDNMVAFPPSTPSPASTWGTVQSVQASSSRNSSVSFLGGLVGLPRVVGSITTDIGPDDPMSAMVLGPPPSTGQSSPTQPGQPRSVLLSSLDLGLQPTGGDTLSINEGDFNRLSQTFTRITVEDSRFGPYSHMSDSEVVDIHIGPGTSLMLPETRREGSLRGTSSGYLSLGRTNSEPSSSRHGSTDSIAPSASAGTTPLRSAMRPPQRRNSSLSNASGRARSFTSTQASVRFDSPVVRVEPNHAIISTSPSNSQVIEQHAPVEAFPMSLGSLESLSQPFPMTTTETNTHASAGSVPREL